MKRWVVVLLILGACSQGWTSSGRDNFIAECSESGRVFPSECRCIQDQLEEEGFTPEDVKNFDMESDSPLNTEIFDIMRDCAGE